MPTVAYSVALDPSGRAGCKGACKQKIPKGALRFGAVAEASWDGTQTYWRNITCVTKRVAENALVATRRVAPALLSCRVRLSISPHMVPGSPRVLGQAFYGGDITQIGGFNELPVEEQERFEALFDSLINGGAPPTIPEPVQAAAPAPKKSKKAAAVVDLDEEEEEEAAPVAKVSKKEAKSTPSAASKKAAATKKTNATAAEAEALAAAAAADVKSSAAKQGRAARAAAREKQE